jgi:tetratricopeptide (TPR) repeat protein
MRRKMTSFMTDSQMAPAAYNLCIILAKDRLDEAIGFCKKASEIQPDDPKYTYTLAFYFYQQGNRDVAVKTLNDLIQKHPEYRDAQMLLREITNRKL